MDKACPKCGYVLTAFDTQCPRCSRLGQTACEICGQPGAVGSCDRCRKMICRGCLHRAGDLSLCAACASGDAPVTVAAGQEDTGSNEWFAQLGRVVRGDPLWGVLLGLLTLNVVIAFAQLSILRVIITLLILWGIFTLQRWAYCVVMGLSALSLLLLAIPLVRVNAPESSGGGAHMTPGTLVLASIASAIYVLTIIVLWCRRRYFS